MRIYLHIYLAELVKLAACRLIAKRKNHSVHTNYQQLVHNFCHLFLANGHIYICI